MLPHFITLTYHEQVPTPRGAKVHLKAFRRAFRKRYPDAWGLWKLEPQKRGAPHFHLITFGGVVDLAWVVSTWHKLAGGGSEHHRLWHLGQCGNGNRPCVEQASAWGRVDGYLSKYFTKPVGGAEWADFGHAWGEVTRANRARYITVETHEGEPGGVVEFERRMRVERVSKNRLRWILQLAIRDRDGSIERHAINVSKLPGIIDSLYDPNARRSIWTQLISWSPGIDFETDFSDRNARKAFRRSIAAREACHLNNVRMSLRYVGSRTWSSRRPRVVGGIEQVVNVHRPCRTRYGSSSETLRLWHWSHEQAAAKRLQLVAWYLGRGDPASSASGSLTSAPASGPPGPRGNQITGHSVSAGRSVGASILSRLLNPPAS